MRSDKNQPERVCGEEVYVVGFGRTPIGSFQGSLVRLSAVQLMSTCVEQIFERSNLLHLKPLVQELVVGNVCQAGLKQAPANQVARMAGLPSSTNCSLVNKVCASGMKAITQAVQSIQLGDAKFVVAGGTESMSNAPHLLHMRNGIRYGNGELNDALVADCLSDAETALSMGAVCEHLASKMEISREEQDSFTLSSYERAIHASKEGLFAKEILPLNQLTVDEELSKFRKDKIPSLKAAFPIECNGQVQGTITAASSSKLSDGAAGVLLASKSFCQQHGISPIARIVGYAEATQDPYSFGTSPALAIQQLLQKHPEYTLDSIDLFEINEAFSVVTLANLKLLGIPHDCCNVFGGAVALGHPLGASGARIVCTLINALQSTNKNVGIAAVCHGGGGASAILIELQ